MNVPQGVREVLGQYAVQFVSTVITLPICAPFTLKFMSTFYMKVSGPVGALMNDMVPDCPKYATMIGKQYANAIKARLEPMTEK